MSLWDKVKQATAMGIVASATTYLSWISFAKPDHQVAWADQQPKIVQEISQKYSEVKPRWCSLSPDGTRLAFDALRKDGNSDIFSYHVQKKSLDIIACSEFDEVTPVWRDNGNIEFLIDDGERIGSFNTRTKKLKESLSLSTLGLGALVGLAGIPLLAMLGYAFLRRKEKQSLIEPLMTRPTEAFTAGYLACAGLWAVMEPQLARFPHLADPQQIYFWSSLVVPFAYSMYANAFIDLKPPRLRSFAKKISLLGKYYAKKTYEEKIAVIEEFREVFQKPNQCDLWHANLAFYNDKYDEGFDYLKKGLASVGDRIEILNEAANSVVPVLQLYSKLFSKKKIKTLAMANISLTKLDLQATLSVIDDFVAAQPDIDHYTARALYVQSLVDIWPELKSMAPKKVRKFEKKLELKGETLELRAQNYWQEIIKSILENPEPEKKFKQMDESRNEVLEYVPSKFLQSLLVFKRCSLEDGERLKKERENILYLRNKLIEKTDEKSDVELRSNIVQSLAFVTYEGKAYHVLRHRTSQTLEKVINDEKFKGDRNAVLVGTIELLARIHEQRPDGIEIKKPSQDHYSQRLVDIFYKQLANPNTNMVLRKSLNDALQKTGRRIQEVLNDAPHGWYKDANPRNWLVEDNGKIVAIDFENRFYMPVQLDIVSLLEFGTAPVSTDQRYELIEHYHKSSKADKKDYAVFFHQYKYAALQRHLELAGHSMRNNRIAAWRFHLSGAKAYAQMCNEFSLARELDMLTNAKA